MQFSMRLQQKLDKLCRGYKTLRPRLTKYCRGRVPSVPGGVDAYASPLRYAVVRPSFRHTHGQCRPEVSR